MGEVRGLPKRKLDAITQPKCTQRKHVKTSFSGREWRKYILPLQSREIVLLRETSKRKRKLPNNGFFYRFVKF
jgi:hypothetical protein